MVASVDGLLEKLLGQYQVLTYFIVVSNVVHVYLNHYLLQHYLWTPPHHCKVPPDWDESLALPILSQSIRTNSSIQFDKNRPKLPPVYDLDRISQTIRKSQTSSAVKGLNGNPTAAKLVTKNTEGLEPLQKPISLQNQTILVFHDFKPTGNIVSENQSRRGTNRKKLSSQIGPPGISRLIRKPKDPSTAEPERVNSYTENIPVPQWNRTEYSSCEMYIEPSQHLKGTQPCLYGYVFNLEKHEWTITAEWGLVCGRAWIHHWLRVSYSVGLVIGGIIFGLLSDRFGRRNLLLMCVGAVGGLGLSLHFVKRLLAYIVIRCLQAVFSQGLHLTSWTLIAEMLPPRWRCRGLVLAGGAAPLGSILAAVAALHLGHWRAIQLASSLPVLASLCYSCLIPESLRWLLTRGKVINAHREANRSARLNLLMLPPTAYSHLKTLSTNLTQDETLTQSIGPVFNPTCLITSPRIRRNLFIVSVLWFAITVTEKVLKGEVAPFGTDGLIVRKKGEGILFLKMKNPLVESLVVAGVDAGGVMVALILSSLLYRRSLLIILMLFAAGMTLVFVGTLRVVSDMWRSIPVIWIIMKLVGVLVLASSRSLAGVILPEISPTTARATAVGLCMAVSGLAHIVTPLLILLGDLTYDLVPWIMCTALCLLSALLLFLLPETSGVNLPDVIEEAEVVGLRPKGDLVKSSQDPGYGRAGHPVDIEGLMMQQSDMVFRNSRMVDLASPPIFGSHTLSQDPRYYKPYSKRARNACSATLRGMNASFPVIKPSKYLSGEIKRPFFSSNSTSSCSLYSSTSFVDPNSTNCSTCVKKSLSKGTSSEFLHSCSNLSGEVTSTEENDAESNAEATEIKERFSREFGGSHSGFKMFERIDETIKEETEFDFHEAAIKIRNETRSENDSNGSDNCDHRSAANSRHKTSGKIYSDTLCFSVGEEFENDNEVAFKTKVPKFISNIPKRRRPRQRYVSEDNQGEMAVGALEPKLPKRSVSPTDTTRLNKSGTEGRFAEGFSPNRNIINRNSKLNLSKDASVVPKSFDQNDSVKSNKKELPRHYFYKSTVGRQTGSTESSSKSRRVDNNNLKTQSFILPKKSNIGAEVALKIAKFETGEAATTVRSSHSRIPVLTATKKMAPQVPSDSDRLNRNFERGDIITTSVSERLKKFEPQRPRLPKKTNNKSSPKENKNGTYKINKGNQRNLKPSVNGAFLKHEFDVRNEDLKSPGDYKSRFM